MQKGIKMLSKEKIEELIELWINGNCTGGLNVLSARKGVMTELNKMPHARAMLAVTRLYEHLSSLEDAQFQLGKLMRLLEVNEETPYQPA